MSANSLVNQQEDHDLATRRAFQLQGFQQPRWRIAGRLLHQGELLRGRLKRYTING